MPYDDFNFDDFDDIPDFDADDLDDLRELADQPVSSEDDDFFPEGMESNADLPGYSCTIDVSSDRVKAYATVHAPLNEEVSTDLVLNALAREKIRAGIHKQALAKLISKQGAREKPVLIAKGSLPENGVDGRLQTFFESKPSPKVIENEKGKVDYKESGILQHVKSGQLLAIRIPPTQGIPGISVYGDQIKALAGKDAHLKSGMNTEFIDPQKTRLAATSSGCVIWHTGGEVEVSDTYVIDGDVDMKCGNIYFEGSILIKGDVRSGFRVVATKDIEIRGVVEDAEIHCGGNLMIRKGVVGSGKGLIKVNGNAHIRFFENQRLICNGDLNIADSILFSDVTVGGSISIRHGRGVIIGGYTRCQQGIEARVLGNLHYSHTFIYASYNPHVDKWIERFQKSLGKAEKTKDKIQEAISKISMKKHRDPDNYDFSYEEHLAVLNDAYQTYNSLVEKVEEEYSTLFDKRALDFRQGYIKAIRKVYPGVYMVIGDAKKKIDQEFPGGYFCYTSGKIDRLTKDRVV